MAFDSELLVRGGFFEKEDTVVLDGGLEREWLESLNWGVFSWVWFGVNRVKITILRTSSPSQKVV